MKTLLIVAGLFFTLFGGAIAWFASSDPGHEYDLSLVIPIDTRHMPRAVNLPKVESTSSAEVDSPPAVDGRAEAGNAPVFPERPPVQLNYATGAASEAPR
ncbi:protein translocase subunit SecG [Rhodomicrobium vannielii ATCC 17100]|jgi:hypothetical protein|uniref:Protein translocase subunit SecG n=1 Tax=Rhodomicrobium vannielii (strain ATCC 17100 / DSM 162 / LMG 4299 / NCIMB 10020 / ATH 3.1.1) TaxID=648757 RepID=E3I269_RHOVT|nr:hypothetical protein [Rhodomicrobium vannielii]ADP72456.1 protein translocase subunit SecG [Rhodomicrobium vannielii ATCC 17100]